MAPLTLVATPAKEPLFIGKIRIPGAVYDVEYRGKTFKMHKPLRPSGIFYGPGWMFSFDGVPVCVLMHMDGDNAIAEFERLSGMLGERFDGKLSETLARNAKKVR